METDVKTASKALPDLSSLNFVDDLVQLVASQREQVPLIAFPTTAQGPAQFEVFTAQTFSKFLDAAAACLAAQGLGPAEDTPAVVAVLGSTDIAYCVTFSALLRLGYTVFMLSTRLSTEAYASLLEKTACDVLVYVPGLESVAANIATQRPLRLLKVIPRSTFEELSIEPGPSPWPRPSLSTAKTRRAFILHSSGSTGLPKPIFLTHAAFMAGWGVGYGDRCLNTCPAFHYHGLAMMYRTMAKSGITFFPDFSKPLTSKVIFSLLNTIKPTAFFAVPYTLQLTAEIDASLEIMKSCEVVTASGAVCPDELGNRLTSKGVHLVSFCGTSETGPILISNRPRGDPTWDYLRIVPALIPYVWMKRVAYNTYEFCALQGMKSLATTNSDNPPGSFHTRDLWTPHPTIEHAWKFVGRLDDRITLANGEKVLPLPLEGRVRQDLLVREAVVFGIGKDMPGLLLFRNEHSQSLPDSELIRRTWPAVEAANSRAEAFSQITREMIVPVRADREYPQTDKGTIIRTRLYLEFKDVIDCAYEQADRSAVHPQESLSMNQMVNALMELIYGPSGILDTNATASADDDLFTAGLDSQKTMLLTRNLRQRFIPGKKISLNVIYEQGNINNLARYLCRSMEGAEDEGAEDDEISIAKMQQLIGTYTARFATPCNGKAQEGRERGHHQSKSDRYSVLLTGSTGSLGSHIIASLMSDPRIDMVYCLLRPTSTSTSTEAAFQSIVHAAHSQPDKIAFMEGRAVFLKADLTAGPDLGLDDDVLADIRDDVMLVVHCGWAVNFNIGLDSFAPLLEGMANLLSFCHSLGTPSQRPTFAFVSSISVALGDSLQAVDSAPSEANGAVSSVPEGPVTDLRAAQKTGYGRSKLCAEHLIADAARALRQSQGPGVILQILRVGQVVGDQHGCIWNPNESVPLMLRTAKMVGALPALDEMCSWLPVDVVADTVVELATKDILNEVESERGLEFFNIVNNGTQFHWTEDLLPELRTAGLDFDTVSQGIWLGKLREAQKEDAAHDPSMKLLDYWERKYGGAPLDEQTLRRPNVRFGITLAEKESKTLRNSVPDLLKDGYIGRFILNWKLV